MSPYALLALLASLAGLACALLGALTRSVRAGVGMMLDLWVAAGLLRLAGAPDARTLAAAALLLLVRRVVVGVLARSAG